MPTSAQRDSVELRALMLPWTNDNPYQTLLRQAVEDAGVQVTSAKVADDWMKILQRSQSDVIHFHWLHNFCIGRSNPRTILKSIAFLRKLYKARKKAKAVVWTCHNLGNHHGWCLALERHIVRIMCRFFDRIIVHHEAAIEDAISYFHIGEMRERFDVIPHGHYLDWYKGTTGKHEARRTLGISDEETVFLFFGQLRANKGIERLLVAYQNMCRSSNSLTRLLLVGTTEPSIAKLVREAAAHEPTIDFREGFVADDQVQLLHAAADVAVLPFSSGLTSGSLILAMGFALPVIAANFGEAKQMANELGGILVQCAEVKELEDALQEMITRRDDWAEMGKRNYLLHSQRNWEDIGKQTVECYRRAIGQRI